MRMKSKYFGRKETLYISYPTWFFTISGKDENELTDDDWELLGSLSEHINNWLLECGYQLDCYHAVAHRAVADCGGVWIIYTGYYGVVNWKQDVLDAYRDWKSNK